jgi:hypothetical protein
MHVTTFEPAIPKNKTFEPASQEHWFFIYFELQVMISNMLLYWLLLYLVAYHIYY